MELISLHKPFKSLNKLIEYVGIACEIVLISTSLLALEMNFSFHPVTHLAIFSWRSLKVLILFFTPTIGNPRYFSNFVTIWAFSMLRMFSLSVTSVLGLKNRAIFCRLIAWLDARSYVLSIWMRQLHSTRMARQNSKLSFVKSRWEILTPLPPRARQ